MSNQSSTSASATQDWAALAGRLLLAAIFIWAGLGKFMNPAGTVGYMQAYGVPAAGLLVFVAAAVELGGGLLLAVGYQARWAALALIAFTLPASFIFHAYWSVPAEQVMNQQIHFFKNLSIIGGLLTVLAHGAGCLAIGRR